MSRQTGRQSPALQALACAAKSERMPLPQPTSITTLPCTAQHGTAQHGTDMSQAVLNWFYSRPALHSCLQRQEEGKGRQTGRFQGLGWAGPLTSKSAGFSRMAEW